MRIFAWSMLFVLGSNLSAQPPLRVEITADPSRGMIYVVPAGKQGVLLFYEKNEGAIRGKQTFTFTRYDTDLKEVWSRNFLLGTGMEYSAHDLDGDQLFVLLTSSARNSRYEIVRLDLNSGDLVSRSGVIPSKVKFEDFVVLQGIAYIGGRTLPTEGTVFARTCLTYALCCIPAFFGGYEFKFQPVLYMIDVSGGSRSGPILIRTTGSSSVTDLGKNQNNGSAEAVLIHRPDKNTFQMEVKEFKLNEPTGSLWVSPRSDNELIYGRVNTLGDQSKLVLGTYGLPIKYKTWNERMSRATGKTSAFTTSNGIFISRFLEGEQEYIRYYPFSQFQSFWESTRDQHPEKSNDPKVQGRVGYSLLVHNVIERGDQCIMIAEAYYPEYETRTEYYYDPNGNYVPRTSQVFAGYRYTHAIMAAFNKEGEKLWDNAFEVMDILTFHLKERVKVLFEGDHVVLAYSVGGMIKSKVISGGQVVDGKQNTEIETTHAGDQVRSSWGSDMDFWYDNYFLSWGFQRIRNYEKSEVGNRTKRTVFYFNKIAFQ